MKVEEQLIAAEEERRKRKRIRASADRVIDLMRFKELCLTYIQKSKGGEQVSRDIYRESEGTL